MCTRFVVTRALEYTPRPSSIRVFHGQLNRFRRRTKTLHCRVQRYVRTHARARARAQTHKLAHRSSDEIKFHGVIYYVVRPSECERLKYKILHYTTLNPAAHPAFNARSKQQVTAPSRMPKNIIISAWNCSYAVKRVVHNCMIALCIKKSEL